LMTVDEFHAWIPPDEQGRWELIDGMPRQQIRSVRFVATSAEEISRLLDELDEFVGIRGLP